MSRFGSTRDEQVKALLLRPYFFDCLHLDGVDLLDAPLSRTQRGAAQGRRADVIPGEVGAPTRPPCCDRRWTPVTKA